VSERLRWDRSGGRGGGPNDGVASGWQGETGVLGLGDFLSLRLLVGKKRRIPAVGDFLGFLCFLSLIWGQPDTKAWAVRWAG
jgi:hypothetical protein